MTVESLIGLKVSALKKLKPMIYYSSLDCIITDISNGWVTINYINTHTGKLNSNYFTIEHLKDFPISNLTEKDVAKALLQL